MRRRAVLEFDVPGYHLAIEIKLRLLTLVLRMEVRRLMLPVEHTNHDSKESRDDRHAIKFTATVQDFRGGGLTAQRSAASRARVTVPKAATAAPFIGLQRRVSPPRI